jgi:hypothetical protein
MILQSPGKIKFFFSLPGEVFLIKKKKKSFYEKFAGRQQYNSFSNLRNLHGDLSIKLNKIEKLDCILQ